MLSLDLFDSRYERELREGAVDDLEYRRMNDLREKMEYLMQAYKKADTDEIRQAIMKRYNEYKTEREGYMKVREQQVPSRQDPFAYVKPEPKGIGDTQDPQDKMAQLQQRSKKGSLANVAAGIKAFVKGEPEPMGEADNPLDQLPLPSQTRPTPRFGTRTHAQNVYFEILKAWDDERDYIVIPFPNAPNPVTMIRGQIWNAIVDLGSIKDPKRRAKYVEDRFNDFDSFMSWLGNLKRYKVPAKKKGKTPSLPLPIPQQPTGQARPTAPGSPLMDPEFTGIKPPGNLQEKKKSSDLDAKDVGLSRELQKARARFPAAASDLEAGILDQMDQQQQAQQALAQQQADLNRQDQQIAGLAQVNQQQDGILRAQGQEIDRLTQRLQQVMTQPTAAAAAAPVTPQAEPTAPAAAPAPDMVYVPDVPADTATQDREIARLDKQIKQLELMMALKTPAERSDLEDRIRDLEKARDAQEEKKRARRQRKKQATTNVEPTQAQLGFGASGDYLDPSASGDYLDSRLDPSLDPSAIVARVKPKPDQGAKVAAAVAAAQDVIDKAQQSSRRQAVTKEGQAQELINRYLAIDAETDVDAVRKAIQAISRDPSLGATSKARLLGQIGMIIKRHRLPIGRAYYQFMQQYMEEGWSDRGNPTAYSVYIDGREWRAYKSDEHARAVAEKVRANLELQGREQTVTIAPSRTKRVQEDFAMPGTTIPRKSIIQGYTVFFNPDTRVISVTRGGDSEEAAIEQGRIGVSNMKTFRLAVDKLIDRIEKQLSENLTREPRTARERDDMIDRIQRMATQERNPANLQIMKKDIEVLKTKYRDLKEDSDSREAVEMAIMRRMLVAHTDLIMRHGLDVVVVAIEEVAEDVGEVDEIGTSDVSAYVRRVQRILEPDNEV